MRKYILFLLAHIAVFSATAQTGLLGRAANSAISHAASPKIKRIPFDTTVWHYAGHDILIQRYVRKDLSPLYGSDDHQRRIAYAISSFQEELDRMQNCLVTNCNYTAKTASLEILESEKKYFDCTNYENEYHAYLVIAKEQAEAAREKLAADKREQERIDSTAKAEDQNVLTPFDRDHATNNYVQQKAARLKAEEENRIAAAKRAAIEKEREQEENELAAQRLKDDQAHEKYLVKTYGAATAKKLMSGKLWIGMTDKMVLDAYGEPDVHHSKTTAAGTTENWLYANPATKLTFKNHKLTTITD